MPIPTLIIIFSSFLQRVVGRLRHKDEDTNDNLGGTCVRHFVCVCLWCLEIEVSEFENGATERIPETFSRLSVIYTTL